MIRSELISILPRAASMATIPKSSRDIGVANSAFIPGSDSLKQRTSLLFVITDRGLKFKKKKKKKKKKKNVTTPQY